MKRFVVSLIASLIAANVCVAAPKEVPPVAADGGKLKYAEDDKGNRIPDYSYAGYRAGETAIPTVPAKLLATAPAEDNTRMLQAAIDQVSAMPVGADGFRGAVLIPQGKYAISGSLVIRTSGVVLRGSGYGENGTTLLATGTDRRTLIRIEGNADRTEAGKSIEITDDYLPFNARTLTLPAGHGVKAGDTVLVRRPSTKEWIESIQMDDLGGDRHGPSWKPGTRDLVWDRTVTAVDGDKIALDAPLTCPLEKQFGGTVSVYTWPGRIGNVGIENLRLDSSFDAANAKDEEHSWYAVTLTNVADAWIRRVEMHHFVDGIAAWESARRVTVEDCKFLEPVSEIGGWRRNAFFTTGQQVLMQRLYSEDGLHDFVVGFTAAGPNAFVQCEAVRPLGESGAIDSFSAGTLFDNVRMDGRPLTLRNLMYLHQGSGWAATGSTLWNSSAAVIECWKVPGQMNWSMGCWGEFAGNGTWYGSNDSIKPDSLYYAQLSERLDRKVDAKMLVVGSDASSSPTAAVAAQLIAEARQPMLRMGQWIDKLAAQSPIDTKADGVPVVEVRPENPAAPLPHHKLELRNGWLVADGAVLTGGRSGVPWWNMSIRPSEVGKAQPAITRFVPGREGTGYTDNLTEVADNMVAKNKLAIEQHPPLWYERRRDDHERIQRADGEVVAPFYETPFARSGQGLAYDGLSKFDLTRPSAFYASRINQFAELAELRGLVLIHQHYFQHGILEAGAHYADNPWRTANNINNPGFPEPPNYAGDKRIFMAEQFYDLSDQHRRELHRQYIRHALEMTAGRSNVLNLIGEEFTGPLPFVQFWVDTVAEWEKEHGHVLIGLSTTKDVQDAILADPDRAKAIDVIDIRYWWYQPDGTAYAPPGGQNLAPRQWVRQLKPKNPTPESASKAVMEYKTKFPDKAVVYSVEVAPEASGWAALAAGASLANTPKLEPKLAQAIAAMKPGDQSSMLVYHSSKDRLGLNLPRGEYQLRFIDPKTGQITSESTQAMGGQSAIDPVTSVLWLQRAQGVTRGN